MGGFKVLQALRRMREGWIDYPIREGRTLQGIYRFVRHLGTGSYGLAYEAVDLRSGRPVLVKMNKPSKGTLGLELLRRESEILKRLRHPQIPAWLDYRRAGGREALITELAAGRSLEDAIQEEQAVVGEREALKIARSLMEPLGHLHEAGYVHRDVRIPNVMLHGGEATLIDYGLASGIGEQLPEKLRMGLGELAPEARSAAGRFGGGLAAGKAAGAYRPSSASADVWHSVKRRMREPSVASDLYGTGHLLLFLLYAGFEAPDDSDRSWQEELPLSPGTRELIARLLDGGEAGFRSAQEVAEAIDALLNGKGN